MKTLCFLASLLVAVVAWLGAVIDFSLARLADSRRAHLVPGRTFFATYRICRAYLMREPINLQTFRIRDYPRQKGL